MKRVFYTLLAIAFILINKSAIAHVRTTMSNFRPNMAPSQGQVQGTIFFADNNILQQLQQGWNSNLQQAVGSQIKVELWQVNYTPDKKDNTYTDVLLVQKLDANVSYRLIQGGVKYNANYRPLAGNIVAIAYTYVAQNAAIKFSGKPNDGTPASITHQFKSDAKMHLGNNIIYGIYSLTNQGGGSTDFSVKSTIKPDCKTCFGIDDVWNTITDVANDINNFITATLDGATEAVKDLGETIVVDNGVFFLQCGGMITTFLQTGNLPKVRMLSEYGNAYNIANSTIFMGTLPPADKIIVTNLMSVDKRQFTVPIKNEKDYFILMNMGNAFNDPLNYNMNGFPGDVFIHELTHVWQIWHNDALRLCVDGAVNQFKNTIISNQYAYNCDGHNLTDSYNEEQQAMIVQRFYDMLFYVPGGTSRNGNIITCGFEQQWVVQNILRNQPANADAQFTATAQIIAASFDRTIARYTGGVIDHTVAFPSNGNRSDGTGFFLPGKNNNSFFYYSNKTKATSANWGPVRDKFVKENYEFGELGWPERSEALLPDAIGYFQKFNHGFIYWNPKYGAYTVLDKIFDAWKTTGWETGKLGYPISDYISDNPPKSNNRYNEYTDKGYQKFVGGVIFYALPQLAVGVAPGNQNFATIEYGDPNRLVALHNLATTRVTPVKVEINPQPLPPISKVAKRN